MNNKINRDEINMYLSIVGDALDKILLAERARDGRMRKRVIRDAKAEAQDMVFPYKTSLSVLCNMENLRDELFDWGHLKGDLQDVYSKLKELNER